MANNTDKAAEQQPEQPLAETQPAPAKASKTIKLWYYGTTVNHCTVNGKEVCMIPGESFEMNAANIEEAKKNIYIGELMAQGMLDEKSRNPQPENEEVK